MSARIVSQRKFAKLVSTTSPLAQPPGAITRASNLLFTTRGSLQISDGSAQIAAVSATYTRVLSIAAFANLVSGQFPYYSALALNPAQQIGNVTGFTAAVGGIGSDNAAGYYFFGITATIAGGHSDISASQSNFHASVAFDTVDFTWSAVAGATGYSIYIYIPTGDPGSWPVVLVQSVGAVTSYSFTGVLPSTPTQSAPVGNTSYLLQLFNGAVTSGALAFSAVTAGIFPATLPLPASLAPGDPLFNPSPLIPGFSPYGGLAGTVCPIPQIVQFAGQTILILGNGYAPQSTNPSAGSVASVTPLANSFTAAYPTWQAGVAWTTGSVVTDGAGNYYTATQGGVSQTPGPPTWNTAQGAETADGSVIWTSNGPIVSSTAPRGAAHAVVYAGSLWLANTSPTDTSDGIDGPSCLKMSDSNNPNSWNPVNTAFIGRNDGTQITGLQAFTIAALGISPTGSLCVFKEFTTYQVIGVFGSASFEIQPAQTNLGCIAARSIQFIPGFGVVRFSHLGFAVFDGLNDRLISEDIRPYLFGGADSESDITPVDPTFVYRSVSAQTANPPMYFCAMPLKGASGALTRLFCYDLVMKAWTILDLPWEINSLATMTAGEGYPLVVAGKSDGTIQRFQSGDLTWDASDSGQANIAWSFRSPDVFGEGSSERLFYEMVTIRGYGSAAMVSSIVANLWLDGQQIGAQAVDVVPQGGSNLFEARVKIFRSGYRAHLDVSGNNGGATGTIDALDWAVSPKSPLARRVIA